MPKLLKKFIIALSILFIFPINLTAHAEEKLTVTHKDHADSIELQWNSPTFATNATTYSIMRTEGSDSFSQVGEVSDNQLYFYDEIRSDSFETLGYQIIATGGTEANPLVAKSNILYIQDKTFTINSVEFASTNGIRIKWNKPQLPVKSYTIIQTTDTRNTNIAGNHYITSQYIIDGLGASRTEYMDNSGSANQQYLGYQIRALLTNGQEIFTPLFNYKNPAVQTGTTNNYQDKIYLNCNIASTDTIKLTWNRTSAIGPDATYEIYRGENRDNMSVVGETSNNELWFYDQINTAQASTLAYKIVATYTSNNQADTENVSTESQVVYAIDNSLKFIRANLLTGTKEIYLEWQPTAQRTTNYNIVRAFASKNDTPESSLTFSNFTVKLPDNTSFNSNSVPGNFHYLTDNSLDFNQIITPYIAYKISSDVSGKTHIAYIQNTLLKLPEKPQDKPTGNENTSGNTNNNSQNTTNPDFSATLYGNEVVLKWTPSGLGKSFGKYVIERMTTAGITEIYTSTNIEDGKYNDKLGTLSAQPVSNGSSADNSSPGLLSSLGSWLTGSGGKNTSSGTSGGPTSTANTISGTNPGINPDSIMFYKLTVYAWDNSVNKEYQANIQQSSGGSDTSKQNNQGESSDDNSDSFWSGITQDIFNNFSSGGLGYNSQIDPNAIVPNDTSKFVDAIFNSLKSTDNTPLGEEHNTVLKNKIKIITQDIHSQGHGLTGLELSKSVLQQIAETSKSDKVLDDIIKASNNTTINKVKDYLKTEQGFTSIGKTDTKVDTTANVAPMDAKQSVNYINQFSSDINPLKAFSKDGLLGLIKSLVNLAIYFSGLITVIFIIIGGYQYLSSAGNAEGGKNATKTITNALIGLGIIVFAYIIVNTALDFLLNQKIPSL